MRLRPNRYFFGLNFEPPISLFFCLSNSWWLILSAWLCSSLMIESCSSVFVHCFMILFDISWGRIGRKWESERRVFRFPYQISTLDSSVSFFFFFFNSIWHVLGAIWLVLDKLEGDPVQDPLECPPWSLNP